MYHLKNETFINPLLIILTDVINDFQLILVLSVNLLSVSVLYSSKNKNVISSFYLAQQKFGISTYCCSVDVTSMRARLLLFQVLLHSLQILVIGVGFYEFVLGLKYAQLATYPLQPLFAAQLFMTRSIV